MYRYADSTHNLERYTPEFEKSVSVYIGRIGERLAERYLHENGFEFISFSDCLLMKQEQEYLPRAIKKAQEEIRQKQDRVAYSIHVALNSLLRSARGEYELSSSSSGSRYIFLSNRLGQSTLIYYWEVDYPITPRKSMRLISKSHFKRIKIDNKVLLARKFSKKTKELARKMKNLVLVEAEPSKRKAHVEGAIDDNYLISLLLKVLQMPEREWREELKREQKALTSEEEVFRVSSYKERLSSLKEKLETSKADKTIKQLFGERWNKFLEFCKAWEEAPEVPTGKKDILPSDFSITDFPNRLPSPDWGFDYVARKGSQNYFVEVKTNKGRLRKYQRRMIMKGKEFGFIPMVIRVSIIARLEEVTTEAF